MGHQETHSYEWVSNLNPGAEGQNRTADTAVFSRVLYRLSYLGAGSLYSVIPLQAILATTHHTGAALEGSTRGCIIRVSPLVSPQEVEHEALGTRSYA